MVEHMEAVVDDAARICLNLGCGGKILPKPFINVDLANNWSKVQPDLVCDVTGRLPFTDDYADEVHAYHVFEHLQRFKSEECLTEWVRVLKSGGLLVLEMPCLDKIIRNFAQCLIDKRPIDPRMTLFGLFGDPGYENEEMMHKWCYSQAELASILENQGLIDIKSEPPQTHQKNRDMRMTARKP